MIKLAWFLIKKKVDLIECDVSYVRLNTIIWFMKVWAKTTLPISHLVLSIIKMVNSNELRIFSVVTWRMVGTQYVRTLQHVIWTRNELKEDRTFQHFFTKFVFVTEKTPMLDSEQYIEFILIYVQSNLCTTTTIGTLKLTGDCCSEVALCYKNWKRCFKMVVAVGKWSLTQVWLYYFRGLILFVS